VWRAVVWPSKRAGQDFPDRVLTTGGRERTGPGGAGRGLICASADSEKPETRGGTPSTTGRRGRPWLSPQVEGKRKLAKLLPAHAPNSLVSGFSCRRTGGGLESKSATPRLCPPQHADDAVDSALFDMMGFAVIARTESLSRYEGGGPGPPPPPGDKIFFFFFFFFGVVKFALQGALSSCSISGFSGKSPMPLPRVSCRAGQRSRWTRIA